MMKLVHSCCFLFLLTTSILAQPKAYQLYNHKGKACTWSKMLTDLQKNDIVLFGELHNNPICHWLQLELARDLYSQESGNLLLGAEMFESDNQLLINEYFLGLISERSFEKECRLWPNYPTDYKPLLSFAQENNLSFVATNSPRRYASMVFKQGLTQLKNLPDYSKSFIAPLPIAEDYELGCYREMLEMNSHGMTVDPKFYPQAQMIKDATMAHFIYGNWKPGELFLHFNGSFHSDNKEGIVWYLRLLNPNLKIAVMASVEQEQIDKLDKEHYQKGDYILVIPERMSKSY